MVQDFQRSKAYSWEDIHVHRKDRKKIPFDQVQLSVDYIWKEEGLEYPPKVVEMAKQNRNAEAKASRLKVHVKPEGITSSVLLHELAHSLTSQADTGKSAKHGPRWVGVFIDLLVKYGRHDRHELEVTAKSAGVKFDYSGRVI